MTGDMTWRATCKLNFILLMLSLLLEEEHGFFALFLVLCVHVCLCAHIAYGGQQTILRSCYSPPTMGYGDWTQIHTLFTHVAPLRPVS